jgi:predicted nucleotide-binding protein
MIYGRTPRPKHRFRSRPTSLLGASRLPICWRRSCRGGLDHSSLEDALEANEIKEKLAAAGLTPNGPSRLANDLGDQVRVKGAVVNVFDSGTVQVQGTAAVAARVRELIGAEAETGSRAVRGRVAAPAVSNRDVFVVYGHDITARTQLEAMLRRWNLEPLILEQLPSEGTTLIEKLEKYARDDVRFGVVLATPDDVGNAVGKDDESKFRARQNVVLELGLLLAKLGRPRVAILLKNQATMERPSDLQGLIYLAFTDDVDEVKLQLAKEMHKQGIAIDLGRV